MTNDPSLHAANPMRVPLAKGSLHDLSGAAGPAIDDAVAPVLATGVLAGLGGGLAGTLVTSIAAIGYGRSMLHPIRLVSASIMGDDALARANAMPATLLGLLIIMIAASGVSVLFAWFRRHNYRLRLLTLEGMGFGLVLFGVVRLSMPYLDPMMAANQPWPPLLIAYLVFGACLAAQLPLRVGKITTDVNEVRASLV